MVVVAQLVRVVVCGAAGRRFEPGQPPRISKAPSFLGAFFVFKSFKFQVYSASLHLSAKASSQVSGYKSILRTFEVSNTRSISFALSVLRYTCFFHF